MKYLLILVFCGMSTWGIAQDIAISSIDESLKEEANVVVRKSVHEFNILNPGKAIESYHVTLSIINETGAREATQVVYYSSLEKVQSVSGTIYDKLGKKVKKIKNSDIADQSASGSSMYTDNRVKVLDLSYPSYPYTIVFEYEVQHDELMFYPRWFPQDNISTSVEYAKFTVTVPKDLDINYFEQKIAGSQRESENNLIYEWEVKNIAAFESEPYSPPARDMVPMVMITPKQFEIEGHTGSMSTWEDIAAFEHKLLEGKDELPPGAIADVEKVIAGLNDKKAKAKAIYEFVQNSTRYVSVQLGIGGWEPYDAIYVYENGYGDCKALTNYTKALLAYADIPSIYTSVYAGRGEADIITDFPNARFNHVFLAVPFEQDTIWLECTSQTNPFGYLGSFTSDRHVLMTTEGGGKLVKTPTYSAEDNLQLSNIKVSLDKFGNANAKIKTTYSGLQYENVENQLTESPEEQKKWLLRNVDMKKTNITDFSYQHEPDIIPRITETIEVKSSGYASITGTRLFFEVNPIHKQSYIPRKVSNRQSEVQATINYTDIDSVFFELPEGYHVEHLPNAVSIENKFGKYSATYQLTEKGLLYVRKLVRWKGNYPAEDYVAFRSMMKDIVRHDKTKVVLVGST
jgi:hypothetical protein